MNWLTVRNDDNGSLFTSDVRLEVGDLIEIKDEQRVRRVTYVMGSVRKGWRACFRGQGAVPVGEVHWRRIEGALGQASVPEKPSARTFEPTAPPVAVFPSSGPDSNLREWLRRVPSGGHALLGFDSAWTRRNKGSVAGILLSDREIRTFGPVDATFEEVAGIVQALSATHTVRVVAVDQPLIVPNEGGRRPVEQVVSSPIGRRGGGVQPANRSREGMFDDDAPLWEFLRALDPVLDPLAARDATQGTFAIEVYPAIANIALFQDASAKELLLKYNPERKTFRLEDWKALMEGLSAAFQRLSLDGFAQWARGMLEVREPAKAHQDGADALICLLTLLRWWRSGLDESVIVGDLQSGYMIVPVDEALRRELADGKRG